MAAPTPDDVRLIKPTTMSDPEVQSRIDTALILVGRLNDCSDRVFSQAELDEIQKWLAAHLVSIQEKNATRESVLQADIDVTYQTGKLGSGIMSTVEGQTADMLSFGCLSSMDQIQSQIIFV